MSGGGGGAFVNGRVVGVGFARRCIACALAFFMVCNGNPVGLAKTHPQR